MPINIDASDVDHLQPKHKKMIKEQFKEYLKEVEEYLKKYEEFSLQKIALNRLEDVNIHKSSYTIKTVQPDEIIIILSGDKKNNIAKMSFKTHIKKLENSDKYVFDELDIKQKYADDIKKIYVVRKGDKVYTAFSGGYNTNMDRLYSEIFNKEKSLDSALLHNRSYIIPKEAKGKEFLLLIKYYLDKKKESPDKEVYLDLADFAENYLEKYNKYEYYDDFLRNLPNLVYINEGGMLLYKLKDRLMFHDMESSNFSPIITDIKDKYDVYKIVGGGEYKEIIFNKYYDDIEC